MIASDKSHRVRAVLDAFSLGQREFTGGVAYELYDVGQFISPWAAFRAIHRARVDGFLRDAGGYAGPLSILTITECGVARLQELIHHDMTRTTHAAARSILADMGLPE